MKVETIKISDLKPLDRNVRRHNEKQIDELVRSLDQFGQTRAIVVDEDNNILIGNGLYFALKKRGDETADCYRKTGLSEKDKKKLVLSDNKIFSLGVDNFEVVNEFINEIASEGDFAIAGFDEEIIRKMTADMEQIEEEINSYGIIETPRPVKPIEPTGVPTPTTEGSEEPNHEGPKPYQTIETHVPTSEPERKAIICPSCGEVIYLD